VFARHRAMGLLVGSKMAKVDDLRSFSGNVQLVVTASASEPGARSQYQETLTAILGQDESDQLIGREVSDISRTVGHTAPRRAVSGIKWFGRGGIIFDHLAEYYARAFPEPLRYVGVPGADRFGQEIAITHTTYPSAGFTAPDKFDFGRVWQLKSE
jgi:hypothetical protein